MFTRSYLLVLYLLFFFAIASLVSCSDDDVVNVDKYNDLSYHYHYKNLDSTFHYANRAYEATAGKGSGAAEALNNLVFVNISKMNYNKAYSQIDTIKSITDNQIELLVADVQLMRLCQRESHNKDFYDCYESAKRRISRIRKDYNILTERQKTRLSYAVSEFSLVSSTYYYYIGLISQSIKALDIIEETDYLTLDTAQQLAFFYQIGSGGLLTKGSQESVYQQEFDYLLKCYAIAQKQGYTFWEANSLQAISEHLILPSVRDSLIENNLSAIAYINTDYMPDTLLAGNLAERSLGIFQKYGDVYQIAGAYRTLSQCYWQINDYESALYCLNKALDSNKAIMQAPDLIASIREQLSVVYSALNNKQASDYNRNVYLDLQEETRQDKFLEARASQLDRTANVLNWMIAAIATMTILVIILLLIFDRLRKKNYRKDAISPLLDPLKRWEDKFLSKVSELEEEKSELEDEYNGIQASVVSQKRYHEEQRAKMSLVNYISTFIDRILNETVRIEKDRATAERRLERYEYMKELVDKINECNDVLTAWIKLRHGKVSLHIESFPLQELFDIVNRNMMSFKLKGVELVVHPTDVIVKADKALTLFMLNTISDNARKFTGKDGRVEVDARETDSFVEISVTDNGVGMESDKLSTLFDHKPILNASEDIADVASSKSHGFGLLNCLGIINKYKKISKIFNVCMISAESEKGKGTRLFFRLPKGGMRKLITILLFLSPSFLYASKIEEFADSVYACNVEGRYEEALHYADSCLAYLNKFYLKTHDDKKSLLRMYGDVTAVPPEIKWLHEGVKVNYNVVLSVRNETAVAALALHEWQLYRYNNKVYTQLFREVTADTSIGEYCRVMSKSETNKYITMAILALLFLSIVPAYYFLYYRHHIFYRFCLEKVKLINGILDSDVPLSDKLREVEKIPSDDFPDELREVVSKIMSELRLSASTLEDAQTAIDLMKDECHRARYEHERLYVSNSVLDNCLSTIKHETMYYPSRVRQLIDNMEVDNTAVVEVVSYYKELYHILSQQAMRQLDTIKPTCHKVKIPVEGADTMEKVLADEEMLCYLFELFKRRNDNKEAMVISSSVSGRYVCVEIEMSNIKVTESQASSLFTPIADNIPFLICRQIVRDIGECTGMRGCGISASSTDDGSLSMVITLPYKKNDIT